MLLNLRLLVIDEISMLAPNTLDLISSVLSHVRDCWLPFGGVQMLMTGDFLQLPPVNSPPPAYLKKALKRWCTYYKCKEGEDIPRNDTTPDRPRFAFESLAWKYASPTCVTLNTVYRQSNKRFAALLARCRCGKPLNEDKDMLLDAMKRYPLLMEAEEEKKRSRTTTHVLTSDDGQPRVLSPSGELTTFNLESFSEQIRAFATMKKDFISMIMDYPVEELAYKCEENVFCPDVERYKKEVLNLLAKEKKKKAAEDNEERKESQDASEFISQSEHAEVSTTADGGSHDEDSNGPRRYVPPILSRKDDIPLVFPNHDISLPIFATELCARLDTVAKANESGLLDLQGPSIVYSELIETDDKSNRANFEKLAAPAMLELKVGAQVMLTVNIDVEAGLVNGARGVVIGFAANEGRSLIAYCRHKNLRSYIATQSKKTKSRKTEKELVMVASDAPLTPIVLFANGLIRTVGYYSWFVTQKPVFLSSGKIVLAPNTLWYDETSLQCITGVKHQVPLCVAYAITIHKSQGASLDYAIVDLNGIFEDGQAYVSVSRVRSLPGLFMKSNLSKLAVSDSIPYITVVLPVFTQNVPH